MLFSMFIVSADRHTRYIKTIMAILLVSALIFQAMLLTSCSEQTPETGIDIGQALSATTAAPCFKRADREIPIVFPEDLGPHNDFQTEWWYYTGNLTDASGRRFGYQLTFFRRALLCTTPPGVSRWRTRQLYFAHFAVTDVAEKKFYSDVRMNRESLHIAGARSIPHEVWIDNWRAEKNQGKISLTARGSEFSIDLTLTSEKPVVLQGQNGLSRKSAAPGNASYYFSLPRNRTRGTLATPDGTFEVSGLSWFDHEWSTSALAGDERGWDWFAIHLDDGRDIMVCQVRKKDNRPNNFSFGCISHADGTYTILTSKDFSITPTRTWQSTATGRQYPSGWEILIKPLNQSLTVIPYTPNQEHTGEFIYWEGAVAVSGSGETAGSGYVELTGYP